MLLLEADRHPRVHVGESLLPGIIPILEAMGALARVEAAGFTAKTGSTHWGWGRTPAWDLWFAETDLFDHAWLVDRSRFDALLFDVAAKAGVDVREHAAARRLIWEGDRVVGVEWRRRGEEQTRTARARFVVDATGQGALVARELGLRRLIPGLRHQALWAHYEGTGRLPPPRERQALFSARPGHWVWFFPMPEGRASIGMILLESDRADEEALDAAIAADDELRAVIGPSARRVTPVRRARDWSYRMEQLVGPGWLLVGDAAGFVDPVLSTGVFLAMHGAYYAAVTLTAALAGDRDERAALADYERASQAMFADMLQIARFFYKQTLDRDDYFWKAKAMLVEEHPSVPPRKAFLLLTSGLVRNLALDEAGVAALTRRGRALTDGAAQTGAPPAQLAFIAVHLRYLGVAPPASIFLVIEPADEREAALFRTARLNVSALAPRLDNDPIKIAELDCPLRQLHSELAALDDHAGESLAEFWARQRGALVDALSRLPRSLELVRIFGE